MRLLLDTYVFIWWHSDPARMSLQALRLCQDPANTVLLSVATIWEMQIKLQIGKLKLTLPHVLALEGLPNQRKDPFDRMLVAQANVEGAHLVTHDPIFQQYQVRLAW